VYDPKVQHAQAKRLKAVRSEGDTGRHTHGLEHVDQTYCAIWDHREDDNDDHSRAVQAGSAYTDEELEREKVKDKAFFQQGQEPMQSRIDVHAGAKE